MMGEGCSDRSNIDPDRALRVGSVLIGDPDAIVIVESILIDIKVLAASSGVMNRTGAWRVPSDRIDGKEIILVRSKSGEGQSAGIAAVNEVVGQCAASRSVGQIIRIIVVDVRNSGDFELIGDNGISPGHA